MRLNIEIECTYVLDVVLIRILQFANNCVSCQSVKKYLKYCQKGKHYIELLLRN